MPSRAVKLQGAEESRTPAPRLLYCPTRVGLKLHVFLHLIINEDKERITVQTLIYEWCHDFGDNGTTWGTQDHPPSGHLRSRGVGSGQEERTAAPNPVVDTTCLDAS